MPKIAHISDIHFGPSFDVDVWLRVRRQILQFLPDILVASGDFVDDPEPFPLLCAKAELLQLCAECHSKPQLFVVPGNHDVAEKGNVRNWFRTGWFGRIMFSDTSTIIQRLENSLGIKLGLSGECKALSLGRSLRRLNPKLSILFNTSLTATDGRVQSNNFRARGRRWPTDCYFRQIRIVCLDSNVAGLSPLAFATGQIDANQVTRISEITGLTDGVPPGDGLPEPVLLQVAVLHHHPLPIAITNASLKAKRKEGKLEQFLVLRNGGDLLYKLQQRRFDLVLHGHKHKPQFARVELETSEISPHPLTILAGGSTAKDNETVSDNTLLLIETEPNGRLVISTFESGELSARPSYVEPLSVLKQRAFNRALERTKMQAERLIQEATINGVGHLSGLETVTSLRALTGGQPIRNIPYRVAFPKHGEPLDELFRPVGDSGDRVKAWWESVNGALYPLHSIPSDREEGRCLLEIIDALRPGSRQRLSYAVSNSARNIFSMDRWEHDEKTRLHGGDPVFEQVGRYIAYPINALEFRLALPEELSGATVELRCLRHPAYPNYTLLHGPERRLNPFSFIADEDMQREETRNLRYNREGSSWTLEIHNPVPGYLYALRWRVPTTIADARILGQTRTFQSMLLRKRAELMSGTGTSGAASRDLFVKLARTLMDKFKSFNPEERQVVMLMVYDGASGCLQMVLAHSSDDAEFGAEFVVPLGRGVSGAAMTQRRNVVWSYRPRSTTLIRPIALPGLEARNVVAFPIFHQEQTGELAGHLHAEPGSVVGVAVLASDADASRIAEVQDAEESLILEEAQSLAQGVVFAILRNLSKAGRDGS